ncbi:PepSY domain-containing protein [Alphaproteobacteria bacterium]|jgi:hypothetical protein|nr:PepSY domain-containing protein [Alphaproteobacteria bacterium]
MKMKQMLLPFSAIVLLSAATQVFATGLMTCDSGDRSGWQSKDSLKQQMQNNGWTVRRIKEDGGCYEAYGTNPDGKRVEAYYDPVSLEKLLVARRGVILFRKATSDPETAGE